MQQVIITHPELGYVSVPQLGALASVDGKDYFNFSSVQQRNLFLEAVGSRNYEEVYGLLAVCGCNFDLVNEVLVGDGV